MTYPGPCAAIVIGYSFLLSSMAALLSLLVSQLSGHVYGSDINAMVYLLWPKFQHLKHCTSRLFWTVILTFVQPIFIFPVFSITVVCISGSFTQAILVPFAVSTMLLTPSDMYFWQ